MWLAWRLGQQNPVPRGIASSCSSRWGWEGPCQGSCEQRVGGNKGARAAGVTTATLFCFPLLSLDPRGPPEGDLPNRQSRAVLRATGNPQRVRVPARAHRSPPPWHCRRDHNLGVLHPAAPGWAAGLARAACSLLWLRGAAETLPALGRCRKAS